MPVAEEKKVIPAELSMEVYPHKVIAHLRIANSTSAGPLFVEKTKVFLDPPLQIDLFRIACDGKEISYEGAMAKRKAPGPDDFVRIAPGDSMRATADITGLYGFLPGSHRYIIEYRAFHSNPADPSTLSSIRSNVAEFTFQK